MSNVKKIDVICDTSVSYGSYDIPTECRCNTIDLIWGYCIHCRKQIQPSVLDRIEELEEKVKKLEGKSIVK